MNSLYLTETIVRHRKKDMDKRIVTVDYFKTEGNIFIKGLVFYVLELDFDVSDYLELSEKKVFFFEELFE